MKFCLRIRLLALTALGLTLAQANAETVEFNYVGFAQNFVVPVGITSISVALYGAQGGGTYGGLGGASFADLAVLPGESLNIFVGGQGGFVSTTGTGTAGGGFNGGGNGRQNASGAGGGGATDIRRGSSKLLVAAGGGGGSTACGGGGGGLTGVASC